MQRTNQRFNHWTVLYVFDPDKRGRRKCVCRCDCGRLKIVKEFDTIKNGRSKQCKACAQRKTAKDAAISRDEYIIENGLYEYPTQILKFGIR